MTTEIGPFAAVPPDLAAQRRRSWATGAGLVLVSGVVVAAMVVAGQGSPSPRPVSTQAAVAAPPSSAAPAASASAASASAASAPAASAPATTTVPRTTAVIDVDGDGRPDVATTRFLTKRTARVVVQLASGKSLTSKAFSLYQQAGAGTIFAADVNGDHRSELLVSDPGADGVGYRLFSSVGSALVAVAGPQGNELYVGGGMYYNGTFGCTGSQLVQVKERPDVKSTAHLPADPSFVVTTTTFDLADGVLTVAGTASVHVADRAAANAVLAGRGNGCGTAP